MATITNLFIDQGSDYSSIITLTNQDGTVINLTGYTVASQFRKSATSSTSVAFTATVNNAATGQIRLQLSASASSAIAAGRYVYDIEITLSGAKRRVLEGLVVISPEVTR